MDSTGITTATFTNRNPHANPDTDVDATQADELIMAGTYGEQIVPFTRYGQDGAREVTRGLPANLSTNPLR